MEKQKIDKRVALTKNLLKNALVRLMKDQHISKISVRTLCDEASVNRSTFYAHFSDQYDLLYHVEQEVLENLKKYIDTQDLTGSLPISTQSLGRILEYVKDNAELSKVLLSENCDFTFQKDVVQLAQLVTAHMNQSVDARTQDYIKEFGVTGCISVLQKWLQDGMIESTEKMTELIMQVLSQGVSSF